MNLNQVTVPVRDLSRAIDFYQALGLRLIVRAEPHYARFECPDGDSTFSLHLQEVLPVGEGAWVYFETQALDSIVRTLEEKGILFDEPPADKPWLWREARLRDPDGNRVVLFWAGEARKNPPWRIEAV